MSYWSGLYPEDTQKLIKDGVDLMMKTAIKLLGRKDDSSTLALKNKDSDMPSDVEDDQEGGAGGGKA
jgi:hypothetical protein